MTTKAHQLTLAVRGRVGDLVYQRVAKGKGNIETDGHYDLQLRQERPRVDAGSPQQLKTRARIATGTNAYQALTAAERQTWRSRAAKTRLTGYNLFMRDYCAAHPLEEF